VIYRRLRKALRLNLDTVAKRSGYSAAYISAVERGRRPMLTHVADALRVVYDRELQRALAADGGAS